jgi:hypothetical protein
MRSRRDFLLVRDRLDQLSARLGDTDWLDRAFSTGDLMMVSVAAQIEVIGHSARMTEPGRLSPAAKRGSLTSGRSTLNWRFTPASHRPAD